MSNNHFYIQIFFRCRSVKAQASVAKNDIQCFNIKFKYFYVSELTYYYMSNI
jgi:hypothetical protein